MIIVANSARMLCGANVYKAGKALSESPNED